MALCILISLSEKTVGRFCGPSGWCDLGNRELQVSLVCATHTQTFQVQLTVTTPREQ